MRILSSQPLVEKLRDEIKNRVSRLIDRKIQPHLGVILVGRDEDSLRFIRIKNRMSAEVGIGISLYHLKEQSSFQEVKKTIDNLIADPQIQGVIIQLPLPSYFSSSQTDQLISLLSPMKDVDGLRGDWQQLTYSSGTFSTLLRPQPLALPPMVSSVCSLLDHYHLSLEGKKIVLVGKGRLVGEPLFQFFCKQGLDAQAVTSQTDHILDITREADILIAGTGEENLITSQWVKEGAVIIDCDDDVQADSVGPVASALSPSVGGVGPLTVAWLLHNVAQAATNQSSN